MPLTLNRLDPLSYAILWYCYVQVLHGDISQHQRDLTINQFRKNQFQVLVATDVAARGIDVSNVDLVVQYRPPRDSGGFFPNSDDTLHIYSLDALCLAPLLSIGSAFRFKAVP